MHGGLFFEVGRDARTPDGTGHGVLVVLRYGHDWTLGSIRKAFLADAGPQKFFGVRVEHPAVDGVRDLAPILNFTDHVLERAPRDRSRIEMPFQEEDAGR